MPSSENASVEVAAVRAEPAPAPEAVAHPHDLRGRQTLVIVLVIIVWTFAYNILIKGQTVTRAFFQILDTVSDDFVMGSALTIFAGVGIVAAYSLTKLYGQVIACPYSFRTLETLVYGDLKAGRIKVFFYKLLTFRDQPHTGRVCPERVSFMLLSFALTYAMSWVYVILFSEALFFFSWSSGVDLPINEHNILLMPTLALAIPFSARVMAFLRYPYAQDYADFMPMAAFAFLVITALGFLFQSETQHFFLVRAWNEEKLWSALLTNGVFLAFIPVFFEAIFWIVELYRQPAGEKGNH